MAARPLVTVFNSAEANAKAGEATLPAVFSAPIRTDVVSFVHMNISKNKRQAYCVNKYAGKTPSASSWGTGRAVARIPRVAGGGTSRSGQGAFGNMCRGGRMFAPTKSYRKWTRKVSVNQRRYAVVSAIAASAIPALVMARGHKVDEVQELPLVVDDSAQKVQKTANAVKLLERLGAAAELQHVRDSKKIRSGKGKMRNRRYVMRKGPLVIYDEDAGLQQGFRNIPGVELCNVSRLNLLQLAPGGHLGRFCVWTESAFKKLDSIYGSTTTASTEKKGYKLPFNVMANSDLGRIINSDEIQSVVNPVSTSNKRAKLKKNPLRNLGAMVKLNPYAKVIHRQASKNDKARDHARKLKKDRITKISKKKATSPDAIKAQKAAFFAQMTDQPVIDPFQGHDYTKEEVVVEEE